MDSDITLLNRELELENKELKEKMIEKLYTIEKLKEEKDKFEEQIDLLNAELLSIKSGRAYKITQKVKKIIKL